MPVPVEMEKPSFESFSSQKGEGVTREYGGNGKKGGRRTFLQKAKRFGKQGRLGRGFQVDSETYSYFVRILELLKKDEFDTDEERELFVENSLSLTENNEVQFSSNQLVSRVIETILPLAPEDVVLKICQAFTPSLRVIVSDPYASHVLEKLLEVTSSDKWRSSEKLVEWFEKTSLFVLNNFEDFSFETYSSFVMKKALECLCGYVEVPTEKEKSPLAMFKKSNLLVNLYGIRKYNKKWENTLQDFAKRFMAWPQFNDLGQKQETARLLQNVVQTVHRTKDSKAIVKSFILRVLATLTPPLTPDDLAHRTLEVCLSVADNQMYEKIFNEFYKSHLVEYCTGTSYTLQKIVATAPDSKMFHLIFEELSSNIETLIKDGKAVIIHHLAEQCNKLNTKQTELYHLLQKGFKSVHGKKSNILFSLMALGSHNNETAENTDKFNSSYFGTCAVEQLMDFSNPSGAEIVNCLTEMDEAQLRTLALDRKASFVISKFFKSWKVPQKTKAQLLKKLKVALVELASTTFGSRIIDEIWLWADIPQKMEVAEVLSQRIPLLAANKFGRFMVENMGLNAYKRDKKEWVEHMTSVDKRKKDALDIAAELGLKTKNKNVPTTPESKVTQEESKSAKKKSKKRKSEEEPINQNVNDDLTETPKKKKKNKKSTAEDSFHTADESQDTNTPKKKKSKKSEGTSVNNDSFVSAVEALEEAETPKKKKKKGRKSEVEISINDSPQSEATSSHKKKNKKRKSENTINDDDNNTDLNIASPDVETPTKKKKKKSRKSEAISDADTTMEAEQGEEGQNETPKKKKKRKSEIVAESLDISQDDVETPKKKKKNRKSKQFD